MPIQTSQEMPEQEMQSLNALEFTQNPPAQSKLELKTDGCRIFFFETERGIYHLLSTALQMEWIHPYIPKVYEHIVGCLKQGKFLVEWNDLLANLPPYAKTSNSHQYQVMRFETERVPTIWIRSKSGGPQFDLRWDEANGYWLHRNLEVKFHEEDFSAQLHLPQIIVAIFENPVVIIESSLKEETDQEIKLIFKTFRYRNLVILDCNFKSQGMIEQQLNNLDPEDTIFFKNPNLTRHKSLIIRCVQTEHNVLVTSVPGIENCLPFNLVCYSVIFSELKYPNST